MTAMPQLIAASAALCLAVACTSVETGDYGHRYTSGAGSAAYTADYVQSDGAAPRGGGYTPESFAGFAGWPQGARLDDRIEPGTCSAFGQARACDSSGDGRIDGYGVPAFGTWNTATLRINRAGEAFAWDAACACWARASELDGAVYEPAGA